MSKIFIDLDSLLDTRLGTLVSKDANYLFDTITNPAYYERDTHYFLLEAKEFNELYKNRDIYTLSKSAATQICLMLPKFLNDMLNDDIDRPNRTQPEIVINIYPYQLDEFALESIKECVTYYSREVAVVNAVYLSPKQLTPNYLKDFELVIMYEYAVWLETQALAFKRTQLPNVSLLLPKVYFLPKPTEEEFKQLPFGKDQPFDELELIMKPLIDLQICAGTYWCCIPPSAGEALNKE